jgi:hypothetical protein
MTKLNYHNNQDVEQLINKIKGNGDIVEDILDLLNKRQSITMPPTHNNIYLCRWNGDEIVQIHTKETLYNEYKDTNLFDDKVYFDNNNLKYDFRNWLEVLKEWQVKKYDFATTLRDDNFEITLIKEGQ